MKPKQSAPKPEPKKVGRPLKIIDDEKTIATLSGLARIQCTTKEAANVLGISEPTFFEFLKRSLKASEAWEFGKQSGLASLRRNQFKMSESNAAMAIWLGKQFLNQKDRREVEVGNPGDFDRMSNDELIEFISGRASSPGTGQESLDAPGGHRKTREQLN